jgi:hypothetical protein
MAKWAYNTEAARQPGWCDWLQDISFTGTGKTTFLYSDDVVIGDGGTSPVGWALGGQVKTGGVVGHAHVLRYGPPVAGDVDVILFKPDPVDTVVNLPVSSGGASWQLKTFVPGHYVAAWRLASGGETALVTLNTADNVRTVVHLSRWR